MLRVSTVVLCAASVFAGISYGQAAPLPPAQQAPTAAQAQQIPLASAQPLAAKPAATPLPPLKVDAGSVLTFYLQTRLRPTAEDPLDALPQGTALHVKILRPIDSTVDRDGSEFHGWVVSDLSLGDGVVIHAESEVRGLLVLLRSRNHPDGFRYELLLTELTDHGRSYPLTASLNMSFFDASPRAAATKVAAKDSAKPNTPGNTSIPVDVHP
jgi:hypothetical protein